MISEAITIQGVLTKDDFECVEDQPDQVGDPVEEVFAVQHRPIEEGFDPVDADQPDVRVCREVREEAKPPGEAVVHHGREHDQGHEDGTEDDLALRQAEADGPVTQPVREARFERGVGDQGLPEFGNQEDAKARQGDVGAHGCRGFGFGTDAADVRLKGIKPFF